MGLSHDELLMSGTIGMQQEGERVWEPQYTEIMAKDYEKCKMYIHKQDQLFSLAKREYVYYFGDQRKVLNINPLL